MKRPVTSRGKMMTFSRLMSFSILSIILLNFYTIELEASVCGGCSIPSYNGSADNAQQNADANIYGPYANAPRYVLTEQFFYQSLYFQAEYHFGKIPWFVDQYGTFVLAYIPDVAPCGVEPLFDIRYTIADDRIWDLGGTLGFRYHFQNSPAVVGLHLFGDHQESECLIGNQLGLAFEYLTPVWEFRINGYFPVANKERTCKLETFNQYIGNFTVTKFLEERACKGFTAEFGRWLCIDTCWEADFYLFAGLGPYYFDCRKSSKAWGAAFRTRFEWETYVYAEARLNYDELFDFHAEGVVGFRIPLDLNFCIDIADACYHWMHRPVERQAFMRTKRCCLYETNYLPINLIDD